MGQKQCAKCGETVDEAKAFCPECGSAFDEEKKRTSVSEFDRSSQTVQLGQTMFNQMLSDMGLNISKEPKSPDKGRVEVVAPVVQPAAPQSSGPKSAPEPQPRSGNRTWIIIGVLAALLALATAVIVIAAALLLYFRQTD